MLLTVPLAFAVQVYSGVIFGVDGVRGLLNVTDHDVDQTVRCPWLNESLPSRILGSYDQIATQALRESLRQGDARCVLALTDTGLVDPNTQYEDYLPPLFWASTQQQVRRLLATGADPDIKLMDPMYHGRTFIMDCVDRRRLEPMIGAFTDNPAVCTYPENVYNMPEARSEIRDYLYAAIEELSTSSPCEAGFYLQKGVNCTGLTACEEGWFCPGTRAKSRERFPCPAGTYGSHGGAVDVRQCRQCPASRPFSDPASSDQSACRTAPSPDQSTRIISGVREVTAITGY